MKEFSQSDAGSITALLLLAGLVVYWVWKPFRKKRIISPTVESDLIENRLVAQGLSPRVARMWVAVSRFETGNFTSQLFQRSNNLFGMKHPVSRLTLSQYAAASGFAVFDSLADSVDDLRLYMREFNYPFDFDSVEALVYFMKSKGYFEEPLDFYLRGVKVYT